MAIETINVGTTANDGTGDTLRDSFIKCNDNFEQLIPYTGATENLDLGANDLFANAIQVEEITTPQISLLETGGTYTSSIKSLGMSADWELLTPDSSGTIATEENVNTLITDATTPIYEALDTKQNKLFYLKSLAPSSVVTGTLSETQVYRGQITANTFNVVGDYLNLNAIISKVGILSGYTLKIKLSQSATMPSGTTDQIAIYNGPSTILTAQMIRNLAFLVYIDGYPRYSLEGHSFTNSAIIDSIASTNAFSRVEYTRGSTYYLYVSIQLTGSSADSVTLRSLKANNV
jgi:hypothetical protein